MEKDMILQEDLQENAANPILDELEEGSSVLVTGATGLIGSQLVKALAYHSELKNKQVKIIALLRNEEKARKVYGSLLDEGKVQIYLHDITEKFDLTETVDYIIHGASATSSRYFVEKPVETIATALKGTSNVMEFAGEQKVKKVVYLSSLEVYGTPSPDQEYVTETDYGYIDPAQVRSSYSEGKRMAECLCISYAKEYGVPVTIARLSQTFGAGVEYNDGRVFAEFARCVIEKRDIVLHTAGRTVRSYCYTRDAVNAILCLMLRGAVGEAYNVTNMDTAISIRDMAEMVSGLSEDNRTQVIIDIPEDVSGFGYNPEMIIRLDSGKLQNLGWNATVGLKEMFERLIKSMILCR